jgi:diguanylate cyclase (GGDEF)-like protein
MQAVKIGSIVSKSKKVLSQECHIKSAIDMMSQNNISSIVITDDDNRPVGIFTEHDALHATANRIDKQTKLSKVMTKDPFCVHEDVDMHDAYMLMERRGFRHIIVINSDDKFLGVMTEGDFLRHLGFEESTKIKDVAEAMSESILKVDQSYTIEQTALLMSQNNCTYAVVMQGNRTVGVIDEQDITHMYSKAITLEEISDKYKKPTFFIKNKTSLQDATQMMKSHGVHQLLVTDECDNLLGSITRHDILKAMHGTYFELLIKKIEDKTKHERELERLLNFDQLTGLPNRNLFKTCLGKSNARMQDSEKILAVVLLDLDRFKEINDSYGHSIGDELLNIITSRLKKRIRKGDTIARLGGDEFAIILEDIEKIENASLITQNIIEHISSNYRLSNGVDIHISTSAGIALYPQDSTKVEELIQYADSALYKAKHDEKGSYKFYNNDMTESSKKRIKCENRLREAMRENLFELHYQPQVHIQTGKVIGCEALIRLKAEDGSYIPPFEFIPVAEESGLINDIGSWVIQEACRQGKKWLDANHRLTVAVNVSANQMKYQDLSSIIDASLNLSGFDASKLEIEITESAVMQREEEAVAKLHELRAKGVRLAIDDFGTGYSSLAYLKRFPIDVLKIDKSFIDDIPFEKDDMAIATAIIDMGKALGFSVLAEGVENEDQLKFLEEKGCDFFQGYYKSKPLKADDFTKLLEDTK